MTIAIFVGSLLAAMLLGVPIAFSLLLCGAALMVHLNMFDAQILAQNIIEGSNSFPLLAVPFFMLAGEVMNTGGLSKRIVNFALAVVGHVRGGLGYVTIIAACILSALSGSAVADAAALTALLLPMMVRAGHDKSTRVFGRHFPWHLVGLGFVADLVVADAQGKPATSTTSLQG
jgi:tripartite ATP-independent transporter DctM subunit